MVNPDPSLRSAWQIVSAYVTAQIGEGSGNQWGLPGAMELLADHFEKEDTRVDGQPVSERRPTAAGWMPIATAPKDGSRVMVYACEFKRHWYGIGYYFKGVPGDGEGWIAHSFYTAPFNDSSGSITSPTHWMPLPEPPK
jgi:hypothetical protein